MPSYNFEGALKAGVGVSDINREAASRIGYKYEDAIAAGVSEDDILAELQSRYKKSTPPQVEDVNPSAQEMAFGVGETVFSMLSGTPAFLAGSLGKLGSLAQGGISEEALSKAAEDFTPQWTKDITYDPKGIEGRKMTEGIGEAFKAVGQNLARPASLLSAFAAKSPEDAKKIEAETYNKVSPITSALFDIGMAGKVGKDVLTPNKPQAKKVSKMDSRDAVPSRIPEDIFKEYAAEVTAAKDPLVDIPEAPIDVSGVRNPYFTKGVDPTKIDTEVDSVGNKPVFNEQVVESLNRDNAAGFPVAGQMEKATGESTVSLEGVLNRWSRGLPEHVSTFIKSAEDLRIFVAAHEEAHRTWKQGRLEEDLAYEKRVNNEAKKLFEEKKQEGTPVTEADIQKQQEIEDYQREPSPEILQREDSYGQQRTDAEYENLIVDRLSLEDASTDVPVTRADWAEQRKQNKLVAKMKPLKNKVGGRQGGSVNFGFGEKIVDLFGKKPVSKAEFSAEFIKRIPDADPAIINKLYEKYYGDVKTKLSPEETVLARIPGHTETVSPLLKTQEEMLPRWQQEQDVAGGVKGALRNNFSSGGRMTAYRTGNSFIDWHVENILGETKRAQVVIKGIQNEIKGEVKKLIGDTFSFGDKEAGRRSFTETMMGLLDASGEKGLPKIPVEGSPLAKIIRDQHDTLGKLINEELQLQGHEGLPWSPNYLAASFMGPYRVKVLDKQGNILGIISGRTAAERTRGIEYVTESMPDVLFDIPDYNGTFDTSGSNLSRRFGAASEIYNSLKNGSEAAAKFQDTMSEYYKQVQKDYMGYTKHFIEKKGVFGSEGKRPWVDAVENAKDLLEAQLGIIDNGYTWLAEQKLKRDLDAVLRDPSVNMPEAKRYITKYLDHAFGRTEDLLAAVDASISLVAEGLGISPSAIKELGALSRNFALTNVLGASGGFLVSQLVQVPQALTIAASKAIGEGLHGNRAAALHLGLMDYTYAKTKQWDKMTVEGRADFAFFTKQGVMDPHLVEHTIHRKVVPTIGMGPIKKAVYDSVNAIARTGALESDFVGKYTIEAPEANTRGTFAMTLAHYYRSAGLSAKEARIKADKDTSILFVDYSAQERAMIFAKMGEAGKFAQVVNTFKFNNLNQWYTFGSKAQYGTLAALALTSWMVGGLTGLPGMDEAEFVFTALKSKGIDIMTPKEFLMSKPDVVSFGPLNQTATMFGGPATSVHTKMSNSNLVPDDMASFVWPLMSYYTKGFKATGEALSTPTKENISKAVRSGVPGNLKTGVDYFGLTENGLTVDANSVDKNEANTFRRTKAEWKMQTALGVPSLAEYKAKQEMQLMKIDQEAWKANKTSLIQKTVEYATDKNWDQFGKYYEKAVQFDPDNSAQQIMQILESRAESRQMTMTDWQMIKAIKSTTTLHGVNQFQKRQAMQGGK